MLGVEQGAQDGTSVDLSIVEKQKEALDAITSLAIGGSSWEKQLKKHKSTWDDISTYANSVENQRNDPALNQKTKHEYYDNYPAKKMVRRGGGRRPMETCLDW